MEQLVIDVNQQKRKLMEYLHAQHSSGIVGRGFTKNQEHFQIVFEGPGAKTLMNHISLDIDSFGVSTETKSEKCINISMDWPNAVHELGFVDEARVREVEIQTTTKKETNMRLDLAEGRKSRLEKYLQESFGQDITVSNPGHGNDHVFVMETDKATLAKISESMSSMDIENKLVNNGYGLHISLDWPKLVISEGFVKKAQVRKKREAQTPETVRNTTVAARTPNLDRSTKAQVSKVLHSTLAEASIEFATRGTTKDYPAESKVMKILNDTDADKALRILRTLGCVVTTGRKDKATLIITNMYELAQKLEAGKLVAQSQTAKQEEPLTGKEIQKTAALPETHKEDTSQPSVPSARKEEGSATAKSSSKDDSEGLLSNGKLISAVSQVMIDALHKNSITCSKITVNTSGEHITLDAKKLSETEIQKIIIDALTKAKL